MAKHINTYSFHEWSDLNPASYDCTPFAFNSPDVGNLCKCI